jgi:hypothetical protein
MLPAIDERTTMSNVPFGPQDVANILRLFGPRPTIIGEDVAQYDEILLGFLAVFSPQDLFGKMLVKRMADEAWEARRAGRHKTLVFTRKYRKRLEAQALRLNQELRKCGYNPHLDRRLYEQEGNSVRLVDAAAEVLQRNPDEDDHARAFEEGIDYALKLDDLVSSTQKRQVMILALLERYRAVTGQLEEKATKEIVAVIEPKETPTLAPSETPMLTAPEKTEEESS